MVDILDFPLTTWPTGEMWVSWVSLFPTREAKTEYEKPWREEISILEEILILNILEVYFLGGR